MQRTIGRFKTSTLKEKKQPDPSADKVVGGHNANSYLKARRAFNPEKMNRKKNISSALNSQFQQFDSSRGNLNLEDDDSYSLGSIEYPGPPKVAAEKTPTKQKAKGRISGILSSNPFFRNRQSKQGGAISASNHKRTTSLSSPKTPSKQKKDKPPVKHVYSPTRTLVSEATEQTISTIGSNSYLLNHSGMMQDSSTSEGALDGSYGQVTMLDPEETPQRRVSRTNADPPGVRRSPLGETSTPIKKKASPPPQLKVVSSLKQPATSKVRESITRLEHLQQVKERRSSKSPPRRRESRRESSRSPPRQGDLTRESSIHTHTTRRVSSRSPPRKSSSVNESRHRSREASPDQSPTRRTKPSRRSRSPKQEEHSKRGQRRTSVLDHDRHASSRNGSKERQRRSKSPLEKTDHSCSTAKERLRGVRRGVSATTKWESPLKSSKHSGGISSSKHGSSKPSHRRSGSNSSETFQNSLASFQSQSRSKSPRTGKRTSTSSSKHTRRPSETFSNSLSSVPDDAVNPHGASSKSPATRPRKSSETFSGSISSIPGENDSSTPQAATSTRSPSRRPRKSSSNETFSNNLKSSSTRSKSSRRGSNVSSAIAQRISELSSPAPDAGRRKAERRQSNAGDSVRQKAALLQHMSDSTALERLIHKALRIYDRDSCSTLKDHQIQVLKHVVEMATNEGIKVQNKLVLLQDMVEEIVTPQVAAGHTKLTRNATTNNGDYDDFMDDDEGHSSSIATPRESTVSSGDQQQSPHHNQDAFHLDVVPPPKEDEEEEPLAQVEELQVYDPSGRLGMYTGTVSKRTGKPHGDGCLEYPGSGHAYEGEWNQGFWSGFGKHHKSNGDFYEGHFLDDVKHGLGTYYYRDGKRVFQGRYVMGQRVDGKMTYKDGSVYDGQWSNGKRHGRGVYTFVDGSIYKGEFHLDRIHGAGQLVWPDGAKYIGEWSQGVRHGIGKEYAGDGSLRHEGSWRDGNPTS